jgi:uncharacterized delta-60 repeat protein
MRKRSLLWIIIFTFITVMIGIGGNIFAGGKGSIGGGGVGSRYSQAIAELDTSFNGTGIVVYHKAYDRANVGNSIYVDSNGKIYVTGYSINSRGNKDMVIWKYTSSGKLDDTFNRIDNLSKGIVVHNNAAGGNGDDVGNSIYVDSNGKIYVTGYSINSRGNKDMVIWKYTSSGKLDDTFNRIDNLSKGIVVENNAAGGNGDDEGKSIYVDSNGKIYVAGSSTAKAYRVAYLPGREAYFEPVYSPHALGPYNVVIWRYNSDGTVDRTFGRFPPLGRILDGSRIVHNVANSIYVDSNGKIYVTGYGGRLKLSNSEPDWGSNGMNDDMIIFRYNSDGIFDILGTYPGTIYYHGVIHHNAAGGNGPDVGKSIYVDKYGKIYVTGYSYGGSNSYDMVIWKYNNDGTLDSSFGNGGIVVHHNAAGGNGEDGGNSIYVDKYGKIYVTGYSWNGRDYDMVTWKYNSDGTLDDRFGNGGIIVHHNVAGGNGNDYGNSIYVDSEGKVYVTGYSLSGSHVDMVICRYKQKVK